MLETLDAHPEQPGKRGLRELGELLQGLLGPGDGSVRSVIVPDDLLPQSVRVFRLRFAVGRAPRSVVIKRLKPEIARRNELVVRRWLPAIALDGSGPPLLGNAVSRGGARVWQVYDDLGPRELDPSAPVRDRVKAAVELVAAVHTRFAGHALMGEVRLEGGDLGAEHHRANVRDAIAALTAWRPPPASRALRRRLLERLRALDDELKHRAQALVELGGPETLLHGDLWAKNVLVLDGDRGPIARLIDWDHAATGRFSYDLSTFLLRFSAADRPWILALYREAVARSGWRLPADAELNLLFETHEHARLANLLIWPAIALAVDRADWGVPALVEAEGWFESFRPVLPGDTAG